MIIVHVLKHAQPNNGHVHVAVDVACAQVDMGHEVHFVSASGPYDELLRQHGVEFHPIRETAGITGALLASFSLLRLMTGVRPDIIHAHMMSSAVVGFAVSKLVRARLVTTVHNSFDSHSVLMRLGRRVIAVSEAERRLLVSRGFKADKVVTVLNGTGGSARLGLPIDDVGGLAQPSIVTLSGLHHRKAVDVTIRAFGSVIKNHLPWHLNIVGEGPQRAELEQLVTELGLSDHVHFVGSTRTPEYLLAQADIFVTAALADPCPLNVIEARLAGCAAVGTTVGGIPELLEQGAAGILVPPSDHGALAAALEPLLGDRDLLETWRARSSTGAGNKFSVSRVAEEHVLVYRQVMRATPARAPRSSRS